VISKTASLDKSCIPCDSYAACFDGEPKNAVEMTQTDKTFYQSTFTTGAVDMLIVQFYHSDTRIEQSTPYISIVNKVDSEAFVAINYFNSRSYENEKKAESMQTLFYKVKADASCKLASPLNLSPSKVFKVRYDYPALDA
jgi:hypothetical protein